MAIPKISGFTYTLNMSELNILCKYSASAFFLVPITHEVGIPFETSSAWLGPERMATFD